MPFFCQTDGAFLCVGAVAGALVPLVPGFTNFKVPSPDGGWVWLGNCLRQ